MTRADRQEQKWIKRGMAVVLVLTAALFGVMVWSSVETTTARQQQAERTERIIVTLEDLAERLDVQAGRIDRQASALDRQADRLDGQASALEEQTVELARRADATEQSRAQFRAAVREILAALGETSEVFAEPSPSGGGAETSGSTTDRSEPEPTKDNGKPCPDGRGPKECR